MAYFLQVLIAAGASLKYTRTTDRRRHGEFLARWRHVCAACVLLANAASAQDKPFSHRQHLTLKLVCTTCHQAVAFSTKAADNNLPAVSVCTSCHSDGRTVRAPSARRVDHFNHRSMQNSAILRLFCGLRLLPSSICRFARRGIWTRRIAARVATMGSSNRRTFRAPARFHTWRIAWFATTRSMRRSRAKSAITMFRL